MIKLAQNFCQKNHVILEQILSSKKNTSYVLSCIEIPDINVLAEISRVTAQPFTLNYIAQPLLEEKSQTLYDNSDDVAQIAFENIEEDSLESVVQSLDKAQDLLSSNDDAPIARLINVLIAQAVREEASDIHIEVYESRMRIRFRVDGVLREILQPNFALSSRIVARVKVMAKLDIAEKRLPQDGRISTKMGNKNIDLRVSSIPAAQSEKIVLRLLEKKITKLNLINLGLPDKVYQRLHKLIHKTQGIVLVTGPTGSGKTTTLYAALTELNDYKKNLTTVEDPIEYYLDGINQTMVNTKTEMTFAKSLRAILRQDPDIIMIGEIRDAETAEIAIQSSLTGHLVFSTLHTNTAIGAISRLRDMGIEPFLLASSIAGILAQRLVRLLCEHCKTPVTLIAQEWKNVFSIAYQPKMIIYQESGCDHCHHSGYNGRLGIYELVTLDETLKLMIHSEASEAKMENYFAKEHSTLRGNALELVLTGKTSIDEINRVSN